MAEFKKAVDELKAERLRVEEASDQGAAAAPRRENLRQGLYGLLDATEELCQTLGFVDKQEALTLCAEARQLLETRWGTIYAASETSDAVLTRATRLLHDLVCYAACVRQNLGIDSESKR